MWQLWHCAWSGARSSFFKCFIPRDYSVVLVFEFHRHVNIPVLLCGRFLYVICETAKGFWKLTSYFSLLIKKKVMAGTLCLLSSFPVPVSTIICLFSKNSARISKPSCYRFAVIFISLELKKEITNDKYKCAFHSQIMFQSAPI